MKKRSVYILLIIVLLGVLTFALLLGNDSEKMASINEEKVRLEVFGVYSYDRVDINMKNGFAEHFSRRAGTDGQEILTESYRLSKEDLDIVKSVLDENLPVAKAEIEEAGEEKILDAAEFNISVFDSGGKMKNSLRCISVACPESFLLIKNTVEEILNVEIVDLGI